MPFDIMQYGRSGLQYAQDMATYPSETEALKSKYELQNLQNIAGIEEAKMLPTYERQARESLQALVNDPANKDKPMSELMDLAGRQLISTGNYKTGLKLGEQASLVMDREARVAKAQLERDSAMIDSISNEVYSANTADDMRAVISKYATNPVAVQRLAPLIMKLNSGASVDTVKSDIENGILLPFKQRLDLKKAQIQEREAKIKEEKFKQEEIFKTKKEAIEATNVLLGNLSKYEKVGPAGNKARELALDNLITILGGDKELKSTTEKAVAQPGETLTDFSKFKQGVYGIESDFGKVDTTKPGKQNAVGPMQITPDTFQKAKNLNLIPKDYNINNPTQNKEAGDALLDYYYDKYKDPEKAVAAYFGGEGVINKDGTINLNRKDATGTTIAQYIDKVKEKGGVGAPTEVGASAEAPTDEWKPKPTGAGGRGQQQMERVMVSAKQAVKDLTNLSRLNEGVSVAGFKSGQKGILAATKDALVNKVSKPDYQLYDVAFAGLSRNLATLEAVGAATGLVGLSDQMAKLAVQPNDDVATVYAKLAQARQITETAIDHVLLKTSLSDEEKASLQGFKSDLTKAIPFTFGDLLDLRRAPKGVSLQDLQNKGGAKAESVTVGGKSYTRPANFTDQQWAAYKQAMGVKQ